MQKLLNLLRGKRMEHDLERELRYHMDRRVTDLIASGVSEALILRTPLTHWA